MQDSNLENQNVKEFLINNHLTSTELKQKVEEINTKIASVANEQGHSIELIAITKELSKQNKILELSTALEKFIDDVKQAQSLLNDPDYEEVAEAEIEELATKIKALQTELESLTQKPLKNDDKKAIMEFRPGVGGVEASLFCEELLRMYTRYCNDKKMPIEIISMDYDPEGGLREAILLISEPDAFGKLRFESGVHRVQRVPKTESMGRIHTSTASIVILPHLESKHVDIKSEDLRIDVYRAGGPGGQSVNRTDSAVRVTHIPTGITVACLAGKSQHKNKEMALSILMSKLSEIEESKQSSEINALRESSIKGGDRSAKIRTYNFPQSRVTDHRIGKSWFNIEEIMRGEIEEIVSTVSRVLRAELSN